MSNIQILPLGGQDERNKNCYIIKIDDDIFIFDCGVKSPVNIKFGVSMICPDFSVLKKDIKKIKGIFLGYPAHGNYAGLLYLLQKIGTKVPIYCTKIGKCIIETYLEKRCWNFNKNNNLNFVTVEPFESIFFNKIEIVPFGICNSIPGSVGWVIKTRDGAIVFVDDFIINNDRSKLFQTQISRVESIVRRNVLALLPSMGIVDKNKGFTAPNHKSSSFYQSIIRNSSGRVFVACTDTDANTIINLAKLAKENGRPFSIFSNTFMNVFSNIVKQKLINIKGLQCLQISEIDSSNNAIVVISSNQEQLFKYLISITNNQNNNIVFNPNDVFVLGTQIVPGYEAYAANLLDILSKQDIQTFVLPKNILPMSPSMEDQKFLLDKLLPKYVFPISGLYKSFVKYRECASQTWVKPDQIVFLDNGEEMSIIDGNLNRKRKNVKLTECCINAAGISDSSTHIIYEREKLSEVGVVLVTLYFHKKTQQFIKKLKCKTFGVATNSPSNQEKITSIFENFKLEIAKSLLVLNKKNFIDHKETKRAMKKYLMKAFEKIFDKRPVVLMTIIEI